MKLHCSEIHVATDRPRVLVDITAQVRAAVARSAITDGLCALTVDGTTVSTMPALQNHAGTVGRARLGVMSIKAGAAGTVFFDEFVSRRTGTLGAIVSAVP